MSTFLQMVVIFLCLCVFFKAGKLKFALTTLQKLVLLLDNKFVIKKAAVVSIKTCKTVVIWST